MNHIEALRAALAEGELPWMAAHGPAQPTLDAPEGGDWCLQDGGTNVIAETFYRVSEGIGGTRDAGRLARQIEAACNAAPELLAEVDRLTAERDALRHLLWGEHPECCGQPVVGAEYMGDREMVCCGCPEPSLLNDAQIVASLRAMFPEDAALKEQA